VTFAPLSILDVSLNIMSLGGLALGVGMLVDSSIVVLESIYRCREEGDDLVAATVRGTRDVRGAVVASILTTIGVFLPMVFVEGVAGQAFGDLGMAVVFSLTASLVVALFFIPMLASRRGLDPSTRSRFSLGSLWQLGAWHAFTRDLSRLHTTAARIALFAYLLVRLLLSSLLEVIAKLLLVVILALGWLLTRGLIPDLAFVGWLVTWPFVKAVDLALKAIHHVYPRMLSWSISHVPVVLLLVVGCLSVMYLAARELDSELLPEVHQGEITLEVALPVGTPLEETAAVLTPVEQAILTDIAPIDALIVTLGYDASNTQRSDEGEHTARFKILLAPSDDNQAVEQAVADSIRHRLNAIPDIGTRLTRPVLFSFRTPIEIEVYGDDLHRLRQMAERVKAEISSLSVVTDVETTLRRGAPEVQITYHRDRLRRYGLSIANVANLVRDEVQGRTATRLNLKDRRVPIVVRLQQEDRGAVDDIRQIVVDPEATRSIRLASIAAISVGEGPSEIRRVDGNRVAVVRANLAPGSSLSDAVGEIEARLKTRIEWPPDMSFRSTGQNQEWQRSQRSLLLALVLSVFLVYVIMAAQFESVVYPLVIMFTIPLAFLGTFVTLWVLDIPLSIVVFLGMIMLAGIVVNNAIVLVDYIGQLKRRGMVLTDAVIQAGSVRLRPILMTTATTALGLIPMALGLGDGAEIRTPLAITVISGLVVSTALTLIIVPTMYVLVDQVMAKFTPEPAAGSVESRAGYLPEALYSSGDSLEMDARELREVRRLAQMLDVDGEQSDKEGQS